MQLTAVQVAAVTEPGPALHRRRRREGTYFACVFLHSAFFQLEVQRRRLSLSEVCLLVT